jgi:hypothetical protein
MKPRFGFALFAGAALALHNLSGQRVVGAFFPHPT